LRFGAALLLRVEPIGNLFAVVGDVSRLGHALHSGLLELFRVESGSGLGSVLQDALADFLVGVLLVCNLYPVDGLVLAHGKVHDCEFGVVTQLAHLPFEIVVVVLKEYLLRHFVTVWQLEDLCVQILLLFRDQ